MLLMLANWMHTDFNPKVKQEFVLGWNYGIRFGFNAFSDQKNFDAL